MINSSIDRIVCRTQLLTLADIALYIANEQPTVEAIKGFIEGKREQLKRELEELPSETSEDSN